MLLLLIFSACVSPRRIADLEATVAALQAEQAEQAAELASLKEQLAAAAPAAPVEQVECPTEPPTLRDFRMVPHRDEEGRPDGYRLSAIRRSSWLACHGVMNGDVVLRSHGAPVTDAEALFQALLADPATWDLDILRRGQPTHLP